MAAQFLVHFEAMVDSGERSARTLDPYAWTLRDYILPAWGEWDLVVLNVFAAEVPSEVLGYPVVKPQ